MTALLALNTIDRLIDGDKDIRFRERYTVADAIFMHRIATEPVAKITFYDLPKRKHKGRKHNEIKHFHPNKNKRWVR
ncbi:hypothetical protein [Priestia megaterium]|uniref:hypothetical protein n=1 Tax=Priestia megaterium TaxID=1404 RepID=UPI000BFE7B48|nr:hypothetical protein [Priestia megaterium]PGO60589.1 hypothetical protein CN981_08555 [Priestia megaterium]